MVPPLRNLPQAQSSSVEGANPAQFLTPPPVTEEASGDRRPRASSKRGKKKFKFFSRSNVDPEGGDTSPEVKARQLGFNEAVRPRRYCVSVAFNTSHSERAFDYVLDIVRPELDTLVALIILEHNEQELIQPGRDKRRSLPSVVRDCISRLESKARDVGIDLEVVLRYGRPKETIVEVVSELQVDTLVVGSRNVDFIRRAFGRSISEFCVNSAPCNVLVVKSENSGR
mgnify:FL=1